MEQNNNMADLYGMSQTDYLREYFNKTDTLTRRQLHRTGNRKGI